MTTFSLFVAAALFGFIGGFVLACAFAAAGSKDIWEVTTPGGRRYWLNDAAEVEAALKVDGMLAVRRLRVLT